jgi:dTDP-4-dehydrorhamnose 3,5-epimerase
MKFMETSLKGAFVVTPDFNEDGRGCFARIFCEREFAAQGLAFRFVQCNVSFNRARGTLRGMHYQAPPHADAKLIRCTAGSICDVAVDLRPRSATFKKWQAVVLSAENRKLFYIPAGFAHGFQTLEDHTELTYHHGAFYMPELERGVRYDDPALSIDWPLPVAAISERDRNHPLTGPDFQGVEP